MSSYVEHNILTSAARTTSGTSDAVSTEGQSDLTVYVNTTAASGTSPTLTIKIQDSLDRQTWYDVATLTTVTAAGQLRQTVNNVGNYIRASYTIGGTTPSFTFSVDAVGRN